MAGAMTPPRPVEEWIEELGTIVIDRECYCDTCENAKERVRAALRAYAAEQVAQARAEEREACAKVASAHGTLGRWEMVVTTGNKIAAAIRERK